MTVPWVSPQQLWQRYQGLVLSDPRLCVGCKLLFSIMVEYCNSDTGADCTPTHEELARHIGKSRPWVARYLRRLREAGYLLVHPAPQDSLGPGPRLYQFVGYDYASPLPDNFPPAPPRPPHDYGH